jgi:hypothetical protein
VTIAFLIIIIIVVVIGIRIARVKVTVALGVALDLLFQLIGGEFGLWPPAWRRRDAAVQQAPSQRVHIGALWGDKYVHEHVFVCC